MPVSEFLVVGGGVIGMMTTLQLADAGHTVILVERGHCGREASWAGGGIVSPLYPWRYGPAVSQLSRWSEGFYPELAGRLHEESGIDPEYRQRGLLRSEEHTSELQSRPHLVCRLLLEKKKKIKHEKTKKQKQL